MRTVPPQIRQALWKPRRDRDQQSEAADGPGGPEPSAGILGHLRESIRAMVGANFHRAAICEEQIAGRVGVWV